MEPYSIKNILNYRAIDWNYSDDFFYLTNIPETFEPFTFKPDYFSYGIIRKGYMNCEVDNKPFQIRKQSLLIYRPNQTFKITEIAPQTQGAFVCFSKDFIRSIGGNVLSAFPKSFLDYQFGSFIDLPPGGYKHLSLLFAKVFDVLSNIHKEKWEFSAKNILLVLMNETNLILSAYKKETAYSHNREMSIVTDFCNLVNEHFASNRSLGFYAHKLNISTNYLHKIVRKRLEKTPASVINTALLNEAIQLLRFTNYNISEIANKLAFSDIYAFSKYFKKQMKIPPSAYRETFSVEQNRVQQ